MKSKLQNRSKGKGGERTISEKDVLIKISQATSRVSNLDQLLKTSVRIAAQSLGVDRCSVWLANQNKRHATIKAIYTRKNLQSIRLGTTVDIIKFPRFKKIISEGKFIHFPDISKAKANRFEKEFLAEAKIKSFLILPIKIKNRILGSLNFGTSRKYRTFTPDEIRFCQIIANQIAAGIENARLYEKLEDRTSRLQEQSMRVLRESEEKYRTLLENLPQMIFLKDKNSIYVSANRRFCSALGIKPEEFKGKNDFVFFPKKLAQKYRKDDREVIKTGKTKEVIEDYIEKGKRKIVHTVKTPVLGDDGKPIGVLGIFWDITEREQAKQIQTVTYKIAESVHEVRDLQELYKTIHRVLSRVLDTTNFFIALYDKATDTISLPYCVDQKDRFTTFPARKTLTAYIIKRDKPLLVTGEVRKKLIKSGKVETIGARSKIWLGVPLKTGDEVIGIIAVQSYTNPLAYGKRELEILKYTSAQIASAIQQKKAEDALRESEERYRIVSELTSDYIAKIKVDSENHMVMDMITDGFKRVSGYSIEEIKTPIKWRKAFHPEDRKKLSGFLKNVVLGHQGTIEIRGFTKKREVRWLEVLGQLVWDKKKKRVASIILTAKDITERKKVEDELKMKDMCIESSLNAVGITDLKGKLLYVNESAVNMWGYNTKDEIIGRYLPEFWVGKKVFETIKAMVEKGGKIGEDIGKRKDGSLFEVQFAATSIKDVNGNPKYFFGTFIDITKRKKMEQALRESEEQFRTIVETAPSLLTITDDRGNNLYISPNCEEITGYKQKELIDKMVWWVHEDDMPRAKKIFDRTFRDKVGNKNFEYKAIKKNGEVWYASSSWEPLRDDKGKFKGIIFQTSDITERKRAEEVLRESEETAQAMLNASLEGVLLINIDGTIAALNEALAKGLGKTREELVGASVFDILPPEIAQYRMKQAMKVVRSKKPIRFTDEREGRIFDQSVYPVLDAHGKVARVAVYSYDITERKKAEKVLRDSEEKFRILAEYSPNMIFINKKGKVVYANKRCEEIMGYRKEEFYSPSFDYLSIIAPEHVDSVRTKFRKHMSGEEVAPYEYAILNKEGKRIEAISSTKLITYEGEKAILGIVTDITKRKRAEEEIKQQAKKLAIINAIAATTSKSLKLDQVLQVAIEKTIDMLKLASGAIYLLDENKKELVMMTHKNLPHQFVKKVARVKLRTAKFFNSPLRTGKVLTVNDLSQHPEISKITDKEWHNSVAIVPLIAKKRILGNMNLLGHPGKPFTSDDITILEAVSHQIGIAIDNAILYEQAQREITERIRIEEALQLSQERYELSTKAAKVGVWDWDLKSNKFYIDPNIKEILGYKDKEIPNDIEVWTTYVHPDDLKPVMAAAQECIEGKTPEYVVEHRMMHKDGSVRWILSNGKAIRDKNGKAVRMIGTDTDITERKIAEQAFRQSEKRFRMMAEASPDYIFQTDKSGETIYCSPAIERILGYTPEERQGKKFSTIISPSELPRAKTLFKKIFAGEIIQNLEINLLHKSGRTVPVEVSVVPFFENGKVTRVFGIARDITLRKQSEVALQESEKRYRSLFEDSPISLWEEDFSEIKRYIDKLKRTGVKNFKKYFESHPKEITKCAAMVRVLDINQPTLKLFKAKSKEEIRRGLNKTFLKESYEAFRNEMIAIAEGKKVFETEAVTQTLKGVQNNVLIRWTVAPGYEKTFSKVLVSIIDITERKKAEETVRENEEQLRLLTDSLPVLISYVDTNQRYLFNNKGYEDWFGYSREETRGKHIKEILGKSAYQKIRGYIKKALSGQRVTFENTVPYKDGGTRYVYATYVPDFGEEGNVKGFYALISDITEHKKADDALKESEEKIKNIFASIGDAVTVTDLKGNIIECNQATLDLHKFTSKKEIFGKRSLSLIAPKDHSRAKTNIKKTLEQGFIRDVEYTLLTKHKRQFPGELSANVVRSASGKPIAFVAVTKDISERKEAEKVLRKSRDLNTILQISYKISQIHDLNKMLQLSCQETANALRVERCSISLVDPEKQMGRVNAIYIENQPQPVTLGQEFSLSDFPRVFRLYQRGKRFAHCAPDIGKAGLSEKEKEYFRKEGVKSFVVVPIDTGKRLLGILLAGSMKKQRTFAEPEITFLQTLASHLAVAIQNVRLMDLVKEQAENVEILSQRVISAQEEERKRTAQQLHDEISQDLALMKINTEITRKNVPAELNQVIQRIKDNENLTIQTLNKVRDLTSYLRPPLLDDLGLIDTLRWYIKDFSKRTNIKVKLTSEKYRSRLHQDLEMVLYRIAQEALANVAKHAQATKVSILLEKKNNLVFLVVKDDGIGIDLRKVQRERKMKKGFGLFSMEERVKLLNGSFKLTSKLKKGTSLEVSLPCPKGRRYEKN
jgi:PAS domain S-box-containing protein